MQENEKKHWIKTIFFDYNIPGELQDVIRGYKFTNLVKWFQHNNRSINMVATKKAPAKRKPNAAFMKAMTPSSDLAAIVGSKAQPRTEHTKAVWAYIKKNKLQDSKNKRNINADAALSKVFGGKKTVNMFEMTKYISKHLK